MLGSIPVAARPIVASSHSLASPSLLIKSRGRKNGAGVTSERNDMMIARARNTDPLTSDLAAESVKVTRLEDIALSTLRMAPQGLTSEELAFAIGLSIVTVSPRLRPLYEKGLVMKASETRANRSGRQAIVWMAVPSNGRLF
jgi:DNA-binding transcriptional ArsR family regulator